jgi:hypothetical protein
VPLSAQRLCTATHAYQGDAVVGGKHGMHLLSCIPQDNSSIAGPNELFCFAMDKIGNFISAVFYF